MVAAVVVVAVLVYEADIWMEREYGDGRKQPFGNCVQVHSEPTLADTYSPLSYDYEESAIKIGT